MISPKNAPSSVISLGSKECIIRYPSTIEKKPSEDIDVDFNGLVKFTQNVNEHIPAVIHWFSKMLQFRLIVDLKVESLICIFIDASMTVSLGNQINDRRSFKPHDAYSPSLDEIGIIRQYRGSRLVYSIAEKITASSMPQW